MVDRAHAAAKHAAAQETTSRPHRHNESTTPLDEALRKAVLFNFHANLTILYLTKMMNLFDEQNESEDGEKVYTDFASAVSTDGVERIFAMAETLLNASDERRVNYRQKVDPYLSPLTLIDLIGRIEASLTQEKELLAMVLATTQKHYQPIKDFSQKLWDGPSTVEACHDKAMLLEILKSVHFLTGKNTAGRIGALLDWLSDAGIDHGKDFDTAQAQKRLSDWEDNTTGRDDLVKVGTLLRKCTKLRGKLHGLAASISKTQEEIPIFQAMAEQLRQNGFFPTNGEP